MPSPRERRLASDLRDMEALAERGALAFQTEGAPPERYHVLLDEAGLALADGRVAVRDTHRFELYLHRDYPLRPPVVRWLTPVFHPNLLGPERNGAACIGLWSAAETLPDVCLRLCDLVAYRAFNPHDALDREAAAWVLEHGVMPGADVRQLATLAAPAALRPGSAT